MRRTIRLRIERLTFDGVDPGDRRRFERAFAHACEDALREATLPGALRDRIRLGVDVPAGRSPEALGRALAESIVKAIAAR